MGHRYTCAMQADLLALKLSQIGHAHLRPVDRRRPGARTGVGRGLGGPLAGLAGRGGALAGAGAGVAAEPQPGHSAGLPAFRRRLGLRRARAHGPHTGLDHRGRRCRRAGGARHAPWLCRLHHPRPRLQLPAGPARADRGRARAQQQRARPARGRGHAGAPTPAAAGDFARAGRVHRQLGPARRVRCAAARAHGADREPVRAGRAGAAHGRGQALSAHALHDRCGVGRGHARALHRGRGGGPGLR